MKSTQSWIDQYLNETIEIAKKIDTQSIADASEIFRDLYKNQGRLFILGVGGSAANASHAVNDFRKIVGIEAYCPTDNVSELTAWTNDKSWECVFEQYLHTSKLTKNDAVLIFSVGGGSPTTSKNLVLAAEYTKKIGASLIGIVSRSGGRTKELADVTIMIPVISEERITPHAEGWQGVVWHLIVSLLGDQQKERVL